MWVPGCVHSGNLNDWHAALALGILQHKMEQLQISVPLM